MPVNQLVILALDPGSREFGFAILAQGELTYFGVKTIKPNQHAPAVAKEIARVLTTIIHHYEPRALVIKKADQYQQHAALLHRAAATMKNTGCNQGLMVYEYDAYTVRQKICHPHSATKRQTAQRLVERYPELRTYSQAGSCAKEAYWARLFAAVGVGVVCWQQLRAQSEEA